MKVTPVVFSHAAFDERVVLALHAEVHRVDLQDRGHRDRGPLEVGGVVLDDRPHRIGRLSVVEVGRVLSEPRSAADKLAEVHAAFGVPAVASCEHGDAVLVKDWGRRGWRRHRRRRRGRRWKQGRKKRSRRERRNGRGKWRGVQMRREAVPLDEVDLGALVRGRQEAPVVGRYAVPEGVFGGARGLFVGRRRLVDLHPVGAILRVLHAIRRDALRVRRRRRARRERRRKQRRQRRRGRIVDIALERVVLGLAQRAEEGARCPSQAAADPVVARGQVSPVPRPDGAPVIGKAS